MKTAKTKEVVGCMMIAQSKPPHARSLEGTALLVRSTHSYHFATKKTGAAPSSASGHR
jgi:hypothetical protein